MAGGFDANGYAAHSPGGYSMVACLVPEIVLTCMFLIAIGLGLELIHMIGIPVTNTSVNLARSTGPALFVGGRALQQLWLFWLAPLVGAAIAGVVYPVVAAEPQPQLKKRVAAA